MASDAYTTNHKSHPQPRMVRRLTPKPAEPSHELGLQLTAHEQLLGRQGQPGVRPGRHPDVATGNRRHALVGDAAAAGRR